MTCLSSIANACINKPQPFFIIGAQRSGTTLIRLILNAHSQICIPEEGTFWMPILRDNKHNLERTFTRTKLYNYLQYINKNSQFKLWKIDISDVEERLLSIEKVNTYTLMTTIYEKFMNIQKKSIWGDKTPSFFRMIPILSKLFPKAKFIHIVRDGRDIHLSFKKIGLYHSNLCVDALEWAYKVQKARKNLHQIDPNRYFEIKYEDLVTDFDSNVIELCKFLEVAFEPSMKEFWKNSSKFIGSHHSNKIFQPVTAQSIEKWRTKLKPYEIKKFETISGKILARLGYPLLISQKSIKPKISVLFELAYGLPLRAFRLIKTQIELKISSKFGLPTDAAGKGKISSE